MALTRAFLKSMNLTEEQVNAIIDEHTSVTTALKDQVKEYKEYKEAADKLPQVQKELDDLKKDIADNDWKGKYNKEHDEFEKYKTEISTKETQEKIKAAYRKLLTECKVGEKHIESILRVTDLSGIEMDDKGAFKNLDDLKTKIQSDWSGFISTKETRGSNPETPPEGNGGSGNGGSGGRAAQIAKKYHDNLYGTSKEG